MIDQRVPVTVRTGFLGAGKTTQFHRDRLAALQFQPGGTRLTSGSKDGKLAIWRSVKAVQPEFVADVESSISCLRWSPSGRQLVVGTSDGLVAQFVEGSR
jgi:WD40 repeat protein